MQCIQIHLQQYFQKIIDTKNPKRGILETIVLDPRKIKKIREVKKEKDKDSGVEIIKSVEEYFLYNEKGITYNPGFTTHAANQGIRISLDAITFVPSGIMDLDKNVVLGQLHKAIKPVNQLKMMEDSLVIYRLVIKCSVIKNATPNRYIVWQSNRDY